MTRKIRCKGKEWSVDEYNERLGRENEVIEEFEEKRRILREEELKRMNEIWGKENE